MKNQVFLSYSRKDEKIMRRVYADLTAASLTVWIDDVGIEPGTASWRAAIQEAIDDAGCLVVIFSPDAKNSRWVNEEMSYAETQGKPILPLLASGTEQESVPFGYTGAQWIDIRSRHNDGIEKLLATIRKQLKLPEPDTATPPATSQPAAPALPAPTDRPFGSRSLNPPAADTNKASAPNTSKPPDTASKKANEATSSTKPDAPALPGSSSRFGGTTSRFGSGTPSSSSSFGQPALPDSTSRTSASGASGSRFGSGTTSSSSPFSRSAPPSSTSGSSASGSFGSRFGSSTSGSSTGARPGGPSSTSPATSSRSAFDRRTTPSTGYTSPFGARPSTRAGTSAPLVSRSLSRGGDGGLSTILGYLVGFAVLLLLSYAGYSLLFGGVNRTSLDVGVTYTQGRLNAQTIERDSNRIVTATARQPVTPGAGRTFYALELNFRCDQTTCPLPPQADIFLRDNTSTPYLAREDVLVQGTPTMQAISLGGTTSGWLVFEVPASVVIDTVLVWPQTADGSDGPRPGFLEIPLPVD